MSLSRERIEELAYMSQKGEKTNTSPGCVSSSELRDWPSEEEFCKAGERTFCGDVQAQNFKGLYAWLSDRTRHPRGEVSEALSIAVQGLEKIIRSEDYTETNARVIASATLNMIDRATPTGSAPPKELVDIARGIESLVGKELRADDDAPVTCPHCEGKKRKGER